MELWPTLSIAVNIALLIGILYFLRRLQVDRQRVEALAELRDSLSLLIKEAGEVSKVIGGEMATRQEDAGDWLISLDRKKEELIGLLAEIKQEETRRRQEIDKKPLSSSQDKYSQAILLAESGLSAEEISRKTRIPLGEVELALNLRK